MLAVLLSDNADRQHVNRHKYIHAAAQVSFAAGANSGKKAVFCSLYLLLPAELLSGSNRFVGESAGTIPCFCQILCKCTEIPV